MATAHLLDDPSPAFWLRDSLEPDGRTVASYVPAGYEGYVRALNPVLVERLDGPCERIKWRTLQHESGFTRISAGGPSMRGRP